MAKLIDGRRMSEEILEEVRAEVAQLEVRPVLAVVLVGEDEASKIYVRNKKRACKKVGIEARDYRLPASTSERGLLELVEKLNADEEVNGILVQMPVPGQIDGKRVSEAVVPAKDVDGYTIENARRLEKGEEGLRPATPLGVIEMLERSGVQLKGAHAVVVGRSRTVGRPLAIMLEQKGAQVAVSYTHLTLPTN